MKRPECNLETPPNGAACTRPKGHKGACDSFPAFTRRGRGRPPLNPEGGNTTPVRIRLSDANLEEVGRLIAEGRGRNVSEVVRALLDESARRRRD